MLYLLWLLPTITIAVAILRGRSTSLAAFVGLLVSVPVAVWSGPKPLGASLLIDALFRGLWIGGTIAPYILGGLFFWHIASGRWGTREDPGAMLAEGSPSNESSLDQRRRLFFACFLIGPFAEAATGFGVGMLGTISAIRRLRIPAAPLMLFALLSQTFIPWGGMGSGTLLAAAYARIPASTLGLYSIFPVGLLMLVWLPLFWRTARSAGLSASASECVREVIWIACSLAVLAVATVHLGPEVAMLSSFGPLIVLRYVVDRKPSMSQFIETAKMVLPYLCLISGLAFSRLLPAARDLLSATAKVAPYADLPAWSPLFHAGSWLIAGGVLTAVVRRKVSVLSSEAKSAWRTGKQAIFTVFLFPMMAEVLTVGGISRAVAEAMFSHLSSSALLATPFVSGAIGILSNSGNASSSLFMSSQIAMAVQAGLYIPAVAALQHASGTCMSYFSPVRMTIAASMASGAGKEREVYARLLSSALACFALLLTLAVGIIVVGR